jgi:PHD/YefM family antitoxin component YafN of YafNO toxin-antitoxin module
VKALSEAVTITRNGRDRLVLVSAEEYRRLRRRDRQAIKAEDISDELLALIEPSEMDPKFNYLDEELKDWRP